MPVEAIVREDAAKVRMSGEEDPVHVEGLALEPVGAGIDPGDGGHGGVLVCPDTHPQALVPREGEKLVDDVEALGAVRVVDPGQVGELLKGEAVAQQGQDFGDAPRRGVKGQVAMGGGRRHAGARSGDDFRPKALESIFCDGPAHLSMVPVRRIFFCS